MLAVISQMIEGSVDWEGCLSADSIRESHFLITGGENKLSDISHYYIQVLHSNRTIILLSEGTRMRVQH